MRAGIVVGAGKVADENDLISGCVFPGGAGKGWGSRVWFLPPPGFLSLPACQGTGGAQRCPQQKLVFF
jgi:hypothetical protein